MIEPLATRGANGPDGRKKTRDRRRPRCVRAANWSVDFDIAALLRQQNLARRKHQHVADERRRIGGAGNIRGYIKFRSPIRA